MLPTSSTVEYRLVHPLGPAMLLSYLRLLGMSPSEPTFHPHFTHISWLWAITCSSLTKSGTCGIPPSSEKGRAPEPAAISLQRQFFSTFTFQPLLKTSMFSKEMKSSKNHGTDSSHFLCKICLWKTLSYTLCYLMLLSLGPLSKLSQKEPCLNLLLNS